MAAGGGVWTKPQTGALKGVRMFVTGAQVTRFALANGTPTGFMRSTLRTAPSSVVSRALQAAPGTPAQQAKAAPSFTQVAPPRVRSTPIPGKYARGTLPPAVRQAADQPLTFGKHNGKTVEQMEATQSGYLDWMIAQPPSRNPAFNAVVAAASTYREHLNSQDGGARLTSARYQAQQAAQQPAAAPAAASAAPAPPAATRGPALVPATPARTPALVSTSSTVGASVSFRTLRSSKQGLVTSVHPNGTHAIVQTTDPATGARQYHVVDTATGRTISRASKTQRGAQTRMTKAAAAAAQTAPSATTRPASTPATPPATPAPGTGASARTNGAGQVVLGSPLSGAAPANATVGRTPAARGVSTPGSPTNSADHLYTLDRRSPVFAQEMRNKGTYYAGTTIDTAGGRGDLILAEIQRMHGFDAKPTVVSRAELDRMLNAGEVGGPLFRGAGGTAEAQAFIDGQFWSATLSGRARGAGAYVSADQEIGREYASGGKHLRMALRKDAKVITFNQAVSQAQAWRQREETAVDAALRNRQIDPTEAARRRTTITAVSSDAGYWAAAMGYDAIDGGIYDASRSTRRKTQAQTYVILNRAAVVVSQDLER